MFRKKSQILLDENFYSFPIDHNSKFLEMKIYYSRIIHLYNMNVRYPIERNHDFKRKVAYLLNPEGDLKFTEEKISNFFRSNFFWERLTAEKSDAGFILERLKQGYVYMSDYQILRTWGRREVHLVTIIE